MKTKTLSERLLEHIDWAITYNQKMIKQCTEEPETLSSEAGVLIPLGSLKEKYEKSLKLWERERCETKKRFKEVTLSEERL